MWALWCLACVAPWLARSCLDAQCLSVRIRFPQRASDMSAAARALAGLPHAAAFLARHCNAQGSVKAGLLTSEHGSFLLAQLSAPAASNALCPRMMLQLGGLLGTLQQTTPDCWGHPSVVPRALVLCGEGRHFCAGARLDRMMQRQTGERGVHLASMDLATAPPSPVQCPRAKRSSAPPPCTLQVFT